MKSTQSAGKSGKQGVAGGGKKSGSKKRQQAIIDAAAEIFRQRGYSDASVREVADAVGILKGSLYYYIDSKMDLLYQVLIDVHEGARAITEEVGQLDLPPLERLHIYVRRHVTYNTQHLAKIAVFYHDFNLLTDERRDEIVESRKLYEGFVARLIVEAQERGEVDSGVEPKIAAFFILGGINWLYTWYDPSGAYQAEELGELYAELAIHGLTGSRIASGGAGVDVSQADGGGSGEQRSAGSGGA